MDERFEKNNDILNAVEAANDIFNEGFNFERVLIYCDDWPKTTTFAYKIKKYSYEDEDKR